MPDGVVILGAGHAGVQTAFSLRDEGYDRRIVLVNAEPTTPYQRPPLSKGYLLGKLDGDGVLLKSELLYQHYRIELLSGDAAVQIERGQRRVRLSSGNKLGYDRLVLATGARARRFEVPGLELDGVLTLRTRADADRIKALFQPGRRAVVVGAGFIGLEFAAVARAGGLEVTVVEIADRPMGRALSAPMADFFQAQHAAAGVSFVLGRAVRALHGAESVQEVELSDGARIAAELVVIGVGVAPDTKLAAAAGLAVDDGVLVDDGMVTADPSIYAVGDCTRHPNPHCGGALVRLESVQNATDQARCAAAGIAGRKLAYDAVPWFWSDQGDLKLQIAGVSTGHDLAVVRGAPGSRAFSVFCFRAERLVAVESVNRGPDHILARRLLSSKTSITPDEAGDEAVPLKALLGR